MGITSYIFFIVRNVESMCVIMDNGRIKVEFYSVIINEWCLERKISQELC